MHKSGKLLIAFSVLLTSVVSEPAKAAANPILGALGTVIAVPVGAVMGTVRGTLSTGLDTSHD